MICASPQLDRELKNRFNKLSEFNHDYWSFRGNSRREHGHGYFQYPAMMVPQMVRSILDEACAVHPGIERVYDPFSGSGTSLTESMLKGLSFTGRDINPLALLLCRTKAGPFFSKALFEKANLLIRRIDRSRSLKVVIDFSGRDKWFQKDVQVALSRLHCAINEEPSRWARRFFWVVLVEVVRLTSNSRTSTFKLHIRPKKNIRTRYLDPINLFNQALQKNLESFKSQTDFLLKKNLLFKGRYKGEIKTDLGDSRNNNEKLRNQFDILITSPPYGDNATTVPYGQYSFLPLQWINLSDIDQNIDNNYLKSTHEIDSRSLGGSLRIQNQTAVALSKKSPAFCRTVENLVNEPPDRTKRVTAFFRDLDNCVSPCVEILRPGGLMVWTLGNRRVAGKTVPLDQILQELLEYQGAVPLVKMRRKIPSKRMAYKNSIAETMSDETILVMRKAV